MSENLHEECGVFGVICPQSENIASFVYYGLYSLQHRGQESCGIVVNDDGIFSSHKDLGLVGDVFNADVLAKFPKGKIAIGHVRYGTTGATNRLNCQPIEVNHLKGKMALAHNGNLSNALQLREELELSGAIFHTTTDTETIAYLITRERLKVPSIEEAVSNAMKKIEGAYSCVLMSPTKLIAFRDPHGFRPLCYGKMSDGTYAVASESCSLTAVGAEFIRDIEPGEIVVFSHDGIFSKKEHCNTKAKTTCIFEYIYFARQDSIIDNVGVHESRLRAGQALAKVAPVDADIVIGVPDSGLDAALGYSIASGIPYGMGFIKNRYIGRTFISPGQDNRMDKVKIKLNPIKSSVEGKRVIMIDDSIVRGTTSGQIVKLLRDAGAREIHMRISSPAFLHPCYYGLDIDSEENLIACHHTTQEIAKIIGVDSLAYLPLEDLKNLIGSTEYCAACFNGNYPTEIPLDTRKDRFESKISERK